MIFARIFYRTADGRLRWLGGIPMRGVGMEKFAKLIIHRCIDEIETYRIPVGNSAAGEMACEWTYAALKEIRDNIKEHFGIESK